MLFRTCKICEQKYFLGAKKYRSFTFTILSEYMFISLKFGFCLSSVLKMCLTSVNRA